MRCNKQEFTLTQFTSPQVFLANRNSNEALNDDDTKENDDEEEMEVDCYDSSWSLMISANPNPSSNSKVMTKKKQPETMSRKRKPLSPKYNSSSVLNILSSSSSEATEASKNEEDGKRPQAASASAFAPSSAAALIRPSKRPRKVSPHASGEILKLPHLCIHLICNRTRALG